MKDDKVCNGFGKLPCTCSMPGFCAATACLTPRTQDIVVEYATAMAHVGMDQASGRQGGKLQPEDLLFLVRKARPRTPHALHACVCACVHPVIHCLLGLQQGRYGSRKTSKI